MDSKAKFMGHSIHQMLIVFPLGLLATSVIFDVVALLAEGTRAQLVPVAYYLLLAGVIGGLVAAPFGTADWLAIPRGTRARRIGALHGGGNLVVTLLFAASFYLRWTNGQQPTTLALMLSVGGAVLALVTAWLGGELVARLGIGVHEGAHVDAPSSLKTDSARGEPAMR
jgi:uncharacterized membrane protein